MRSLLMVGVAAATAFAATLPVSLDAMTPSDALEKRQDIPADWYESGTDAGESSQCRYETRMKDWCAQTLDKFSLDGSYGAAG